jgi:hypothetical protein
MSNNQNVTPGLIQPQVSSYTSGAGNPRDSAMMSNQNMNNKQANLNSVVGGRKRRHYKGGNSQPSTVVVPQMQMQYTPQNGNASPNTQIKGLSSTGMQSTANSVYDNQATQNGGSRKRRYKKGGNPNWIWGCYSGGRRRTTRRKSRSIRRGTRRYRR